MSLIKLKKTEDYNGNVAGETITVPDRLVMKPTEQAPDEKLILPTKQELKDLSTTIALDDKREEKKKAVKKEENSEQFITKYRPNDFEQVLGNGAVIKALSQEVKSKNRLHTYLFLGPTGVGKTTLARIIAKEFDATVFEICAAVNSGVDNTRDIVASVQFKPITGKPAILLIIDEAHNLSDKAWEPLLKLIEDPPSYFYMALCSTNPEKIPKTVSMGRCSVVKLKALKTFEIEGLLSTVATVEGWTIKNDVFNAIVLAGEGSARNALTLLYKGHTCESIEELSEVVDVESDNSPTIKLCQMLVKGNKNWTQIAILLKQIEEPEAAISHICNYMTAVMAKSEERQAQEVWHIIQCLSENRATWNKRIQLYAGIGKYLWGGIPF